LKQAIVILLLFLQPASAQEPSTNQNPLAALKATAERVLEESGVPFSQEQKSAVDFMMEDRRKASEDLFGDLFNFAAGPTQGQDADRLNSAIEWMRNEFLLRFRTLLTAEQMEVWTRFENTGGLRPQDPGSSEEVRSAAPRPRNQTQFVRINNNSFTAEDSNFRFGRGTQGQGQAGPEVIQRGGTGAFHGNVELLFKDESLNAGRRFASNKPPYQERQVSLSISGPMIPSRLTTAFTFTRNESKNVDTIRATLPNEIFSLGITKPATNKSFDTTNTLQLMDAHSLVFGGRYRTAGSENQGIGGFTMPERAYSSSSKSWNFEVRQFSTLSSRSIFESRFGLDSSRSRTQPDKEGIRVNVLDAFGIGGAQNRESDEGRTYNFGNLYTRLGERLTVKTGFNGAYRRGKSLSESNFTGTFTFSSLDSFIQGSPIFFRVNRGEPSLETTQLELSFFFQNDLKVTPRLTLMYGVRYQDQTNIRDHNNIDPRLGIAYAMGRATVIRAGAGIFHDRFSFDTVENQRRLDGIRQYEIVIDNPSYPDPFQARTARNTLRSVRVTDPNLTTPHNTIAMLSYERTFFTNLLISAQVDVNRSAHRYRNRNLNAPRDITSPTPRSCRPGQSSETCVRPLPEQGNILNVESTGNEFSDFFRLNYRQRFSVFTVSANYTRQITMSDTPQNLVSNPINVGFTPEGLSSDQYDLRADWTRAAFPMHNVSGSLNARMPWGLFLTGTMSGNTGQSYTIITGKDDNKDTAVNDRPVGLKRNSENGPRILNFNFNVSKAFFFGRPGTGGTRTNANLFANMTNAFNRPNYSRPSGIMTSPNFGKSTSAGDPREIEVGLRFQF
jgi:hypothetical protein